MTVTFRRDRHEMTRVEVYTGRPFDEFVAALERAAPPVDRAAYARIVESGGDWDDVRAAAEKNAPNELMVYAKIDATELFGVAGHHVKSVEYLIGNHVIAETMFRHDPRAMLYAPLRVLVFSDDDGNAVFTMDQPGPAFDSLGGDEIAEVGVSLDRKVAHLLRVVDVDAGQAFV